MEGITQQVIRTPLLRNRVIERVRDLIVDGRLGPGARLVEKDLAELLGVSRGPVREALQQLANEGWVDLRPHHGAFVHRPNMAEIADFFLVRGLIESEASRRAALTPDNGTRTEAIAGLRRIIKEGRAALCPRDPEALVRMNNDFHRAVLEMSDSPALCEIWGMISRRVRWYYAPTTIPRAQDAWNEHDQILEAIVDRNAPLASELATLHIERTRDAYLRL